MSDRNQFIYWKCPQCNDYNRTPKAPQPDLICQTCGCEASKAEVQAQHPPGVVI